MKLSFCFVVMFALYVPLNVMAEDSVPSLAQIETTMHSEQSLPLGNTISFAVKIDKPEALAKSLAKWSHVNVLDTYEDGLRVSVNVNSVYEGPVHNKYLADSFVIDTSEQSVVDFAEGFRVPDDTLFSINTLRDYVIEYIDQPTYIHGFNFASTVATQRSGDCTEHAVLLTALARSFNIPSRVVLGLVLVEDAEKVTTFGHAWTELYYEDSWHMLDAALGEPKDKKYFYLPTSTLDNEGPGYGMSLIDSVLLFPSAISEVASVMPK